MNSKPIEPVRSFAENSKSGALRPGFMLRTSTALKHIARRKAEIVVASIAAAATLSLVGGNASGQVVTDPADVADGSYLLGDSTVYADGGNIYVGGSYTFMDGFRFDLTNTSGALQSFTVTVDYNSNAPAPLGTTISLPFGYYVGGFTNSSSGADLSTEQYVNAGTLEGILVTAATGSGEGLRFYGTDLSNLAQTWINNPAQNYGFVFSSQAPALTALYPTRGGAIPSMESGLGPTSEAIALPDAPGVPEPGTVGMLTAALAVALVLRKSKPLKVKVVDACVSQDA
jgi:hypothetical protein